MSGSWKKWSITKMVSKPACSPATATFTTRSNSGSSLSGYVKFGIWSPMRVMVGIIDHRNFR